MEQLRDKLRHYRENEAYRGFKPLLDHLEPLINVAAATDQEVPIEIARGLMDVIEKLRRTGERMTFNPTSYLGP